MLKAGDTLQNGQVLQRRSAPAGSDAAIFTYATVVGAAGSTGFEMHDQGSTVFKLVLQVRHMPGSYSVLSITRDGTKYEKWKTERRGTIYLDALLVDMQSAKNSESSLVSTSPQPTAGPDVFYCQTQQQAFRYLCTLNVPPAMIDNRFNRCYCSNCYTAGEPDFYVAGNSRWRVPRTWVKFGIIVNPVFNTMNDMLSNWALAFHGCKPQNLVSILQHRTLLIPGDILRNGRRLGRHAFLQTATYHLSPTMTFASHECFAATEDFEGGKAQVVVAFKVKPDDGAMLKRWPGSLKSDFSVDEQLLNTRDLEWYSNRRGCVHPYGILIRVK